MVKVICLVNQVRVITYSTIDEQSLVIIIVGTAPGHPALDAVRFGHVVVVAKPGVAREFVELAVLPAVVLIRGGLQILPQVARR